MNILNTYVYFRYESLQTWKEKKKTNLPMTMGRTLSTVSISFKNLSHD